MNEIKNVKIYGERSSGTNYLASLIEKNFHNITVNPKQYGWKHGFINFKKLKTIDTDHTLFIFISKDPYSWLVSMNKKPHHAPQLYGLKFNEFLKKEWACYKGKNYGSRDLKENPLTDEEEMLNERSPETKKRYGNVILMRNGKNKCFLELRNHVKNYRLLKYENLLKHPELSLKKISSEFKINTTKEFKASSGYHGRNPKKTFSRKRYYLNKEYLKVYKQEDLDFINQHLNHDLELKLKYSILNQIDG